VAVGDAGEREQRQHRELGAERSALGVALGDAHLPVLLRLRREAHVDGPGLGVLAAVVTDGDRLHADEVQRDDFDRDRADRARWRHREGAAVEAVDDRVGVADVVAHEAAEWHAAELDDAVERIRAGAEETSRQLGLRGMELDAGLLRVGLEEVEPGGDRVGGGDWRERGPEDGGNRRGEPHQDPTAQTQHFAPPSARTLPASTGGRTPRVLQPTIHPRDSRHNRFPGAAAGARDSLAA